MKADRLTWVLPALVIAVYLPLVFYGMQPSVDTRFQWRQATGQLPWNDWHPIMHTYLIRLIAYAARTLKGVAAVQVCIFAFLLGQLHATFRRYGYSRWASALIVLVAAFNPFSMAIFRFVWKDTAFALAGLSVTICLIHIFETRGDWLAGRRIALMALCLTLATFLRHNGFFYTVPLMALLPAAVASRNVRKASLCVGVSALCCAGYLLVRSQLTRHGVIEPRPEVQCLVESVGLPMSMISECYMSDRSKTPDDVVRFLESFGDREFWERTYDGDFNSVKWYGDNIKCRIYALGWHMFFDMFWRTVKANPRAALRSFMHVTSIAWSPLPGSIDACACFTRPKRNAVLKALEWYFRIMVHSRKGVIAMAPGSYLLLVALAFCWGVRRGGSRICVLAVPLLCYQFCTMLLLSGKDYRFFYITVLCGAAVCLPIFSQASDQEPET